MAASPADPLLNRPSYANVAARSPQSDVENSGSCHRLGDVICVKIDESIYQKRVQLCRESIIGRLTLIKGDKPWRFEELEKRLQDLWRPAGKWRMISLGRGFYNFHFDEVVDREKIWSMGVWTIKPGHMRMQQWVPDFNPNSQRPTNAQVWARLYDLPWEYWDANILKNIARGIGIPLKIDQNTLDGKFGHFARILIDIDLSKDLTESLMIERQGHKFFISVGFENLPEFCRNCMAVGHSLGSCKRNPVVLKTEANKEKSLKQVYQVKSAAQPLENAQSTKEGETSSLQKVPLVPTEEKNIDDSPVSTQSSTPPQESNQGMTVHENPLAVFSGSKVIVNSLVSPSVSMAAPENLQVVAAASNHYEDNSRDLVNALSPSGLNLSVELPLNKIVEDSVITAILPSDIATHESRLLTSNSWADLAETEDEATKNPTRKAKKTLRPPSTRARRGGHVPNPSL